MCAAQVRYLDWAEGETRQMQVHIDAQEPLIVHVSRAAIDSCLSALQAWSQDRRTWSLQSEGGGTSLPRASSHNSLMQSQGSDARAENTFVPYLVQNMLAEPLLLVTEDGAEYRIASQHWIELSYAQVWGRRSELSKYARDSNDAGINNMVCLQLASARRIFGQVSIEIERTQVFDLEPADPATGSPALRVCSQLSRRNGQKILRVSSMVSLRNCTQTPLKSALLGADDAAPIEMGVIPKDGTIGIPLHMARNGILVVKPVVPGLEYDWCDVKTEAIRLQTVHDGTFRATQMVSCWGFPPWLANMRGGLLMAFASRCCVLVFGLVIVQRVLPAHLSAYRCVAPCEQVDQKFQRIFGAALPGDTTLLHWYPCANDVVGVGLRQGVLYVTERFLCHYSSVMGNVIQEIIPIASITDLKKVNTGGRPLGLAPTRVLTWSPTRVLACCRTKLSHHDACTSL